jgi:uncharacterized lipoprotein YehR (DUF1307 family)
VTRKKYLKGWKMNKLRGLIIAIFLAILLSGCWEEAEIQEGIYTGAYGFEYEGGAFCRLLVIQKSDIEIDFELYCNRGSPSYNMGYALDTIPLSENVATYSSSSFGGECKITFEFQEDKVVVTHEVEAWKYCGFGGNVSAYGTYELIGNSIPEFGCMHPTNPCG